MMQEIRIVFDGDPKSGDSRFVRIENEDGASIGGFEWYWREDDRWELRIPNVDR